MPWPRSISCQRYIDETIPIILMPVARQTKSQKVAASISPIVSPISSRAITFSPASFSIGCVSRAQKQSTVNQALSRLKRRLRVVPFGRRRPIPASTAITRACINVDIERDLRLCPCGRHAARTGLLDDRTRVWRAPERSGR